MRSDNGNASRAAIAPGFVALLVMAAMGLGLVASAAEAAPFAYVTVFDAISVIDTATAPPSVVATIPEGSGPGAVAVTPDGTHAYVANGPSNSVSVIDTATNTLVGAPIPVGSFPAGIAITPDGKHAYVTNDLSSTVSVIDTATNMVVGAPIPVGFNPGGVAVTPDGTQVYVANLSSNNVSVIATASNTVVATIPVGLCPSGVAVTPDGKQAYVTNFTSETVSVIAPATNTVVATVPVGGNGPEGPAVTPDGKHVYVANQLTSTVSVIDTATNTLVGTPIPVGVNPFVVAVTPDGKHAYVANGTANTVSVIDTATNTVEAATITANSPSGIGIVPPPPGVPFLAFNANLNINFGTAPNTDAFTLATSFTLSSTAPVFNPLTDPVTLQIGTFAVTIPPGSFNETGKGIFSFEGVINGVTMKAVLKSTGTLRYNFQVGAQHASLTGTQNAVYVTLAIGGGSFSNSDSGATSVTAMISGAAPSVKAAMSR